MTVNNLFDCGEHRQIADQINISILFLLSQSKSGLFATFVYEAAKKTLIRNFIDS